MARYEISEGVIAGDPLRGIAGATVQVNLQAGGAATVYTGQTGAPTYAGGTLTTDGSGRINGWVDEGDYLLVVSGPVAYTQPWSTPKTGPIGPPGGAGSLVSALPANPVDAQEIYFQNAAMASAGVIWHLRYRAAATGPYKWELVGGQDMMSSTGTPGAFSTVSAQTFTPWTNGPSLTIPLAGDYDITPRVSLGWPNAGGGEAHPRLATPSKGGFGEMIWYSPTQYASMMLAAPARVTGLVAAEAVTMQVATTNAAVTLGWGASGQEFRAVPVRVG